MKLPDSFIELGFLTLLIVSVINLVASGVRAKLLKGLSKEIVLNFTRETLRAGPVIINLS